MSVPRWVAQARLNAVVRSIDFAALSLEDAAAWLRFTVASHEAKLIELARWMSRGAGPVNEADVSWSSLRTVWVLRSQCRQRSPATPLDVLDTQRAAREETSATSNPARLLDLLGKHGRLVVLGSSGQHIPEPAS